MPKYLLSKLQRSQNHHGIGKKEKEVGLGVIQKVELSFRCCWSLSWRLVGRVVQLLLNKGLRGREIARGSFNLERDPPNLGHILQRDQGQIKGVVRVHAGHWERGAAFLVQSGG